MLTRIALITTATCIVLLMLLAVPAMADGPIAQQIPTETPRPTVQPPTPRPSVWPPPRPTFTPTPTQIPSPGPPPVIPEASTVILLSSAATGLAGYVGLQLRARRRK